MLRTYLKKIKNTHLLNMIGIVTILNILLSVTAFLKDVIFAAYFGTSKQSDALMLAYFLPDNIGNNLLAASIGISCIPVFSALYVNENKDRFYKVVRNIGVYFLTFSIALFFLLFIFKSQIINLLGNGFTNENKDLSNKLFIIILPAILIYPLMTIGNSVMQVMNRFRIPAAAPIIYNLLFLLGILIPLLLNINPKEGVYIVSIGIIFGIFSMLVLIYFSLNNTLKTIFKMGNILKAYIPSREDLNDIIGILIVFVPYILIMSASMAVLFVERYLAAGFTEGTISGLNYVYRLTQFPIWVFAASVSVVILPFMSRAKGVGQEEELKRLFSKAMKLNIILSVPIAIILFVFRIPIITVLFKHGAFDSESLKITSDIMAGYSLAIIGQSIMFISLRYFIAVGKMIYPLVLLLITGSINILLDFWLVGIMGPKGLGYSAAAVSFINCLITALMIRKMFGFKQLFQIKYYVKIIIVNFMVLILIKLADNFWYFVKNKGFLIQGAYCALIMAVVFTVYILFLRAFKLLKQII